jgi:hypothetical protein
MDVESKAVTKLPGISEITQHHSDCCLGLSTKLIRRISLLLPPGSLVHSIGSGTGLLEALLQQQHPQIRVEGIEVNESINKYLPEDQVIIVNGTWHVCSASSGASAWLFVYPRDPSLISRYFELYKPPRTIIWLGPKVDWQDFRTPFLRLGSGKLEEILDTGLASYETMFVMTSC